ncbi:spore germination protein GerW family protein [Lentzea sp. HUAS TT2]|uniref:spore germination protein GerW family protein n=1 Tax=Lentzea sp. HUAS TT2 TaxID=3447454 RepID=UPI003F7214B2
MKIDEIMGNTKDSLKARTVYGEPVERDGITVIPAATIAGGAGGGTGKDEKGQQGEGGGFGINAKPAGAYVIDNGKLRWQPAVDVNKLVAIAGSVAVAALLVVARVLRSRQKD